MSAARSDWLKPSARVALCAKLRELWTANPHLSTVQVVAQTRAPINVVEGVRKRLVQQGVLKAAQSWRAP